MTTPSPYPPGYPVAPQPVTPPPAAPAPPETPQQRVEAIGEQITIQTGQVADVLANANVISAKASTVIKAVVAGAMSVVALGFGLYALIEPPAKSCPVLEIPSADQIDPATGEAPPITITQGS